MSFEVLHIYFKLFLIKCSSFKRLKEIKFNLVGFLLAGFETTSTALNYCFYILSTHPDEMQKLQHEIDLYYNDSTDQVCFSIKFSNEA
jgi:hypothetical protein